MIEEAIVGQVITKVRLPTEKEENQEGWIGETTVLELSNGVILYSYYGIAQKMPKEGMQHD